MEIKHTYSINDVAEFENYLRQRLQDKVSDDELDALDDYLGERCANGEAEAVVACLKCAIPMYNEFKRTWAEAYALNTLIFALGELHDITGMTEVLCRAVDYTIEEKTAEAGYSALNNALSLISRKGWASEHLPPIVAQGIRIFAVFPDPYRHVQMLITVAQTYSNYGAFQSAYRALADAEKLARTYSDPKLLANVLDAEVCVASLEPDAKFAIKVGTEAVRLTNMIGLEPSFALRNNLAVAAMNEGDLAIAIPEWEKILEGGGIDEHDRCAILVNLSVCYRRSRKIEQADEALGNARLLFPENGDPEQGLEMELVAAANASVNDYAETMIDCLISAVDHLRRLVSTANRLHYRRGIRERYVPRIERLLCSAPPRGRSTKVLKIIAECRCGTVSDWLSLLDWVESACSNPEVNEADKSALKNCIEQITSLGAPFLMGFREKYDDSLEFGPYKAPWNTFNMLQERLQHLYGLPQPFARAIGESVEALLHEKCLSGAWLFISVNASDSHMLVLRSDEYEIIKSPHRETAEYKSSLFRYVAGEISRREFCDCIQHVHAVLRNSFDSVLSAACENNVNCYIHMPDRNDMIPFTAIVLGHGQSRLRMASGELEVWTCPVAYRGSSANLEWHRVVGVSAEYDIPLLANAEFEIVQRLFNPSEFIRMRFGEDKEHFSEVMDSADVLVVATHGIPISIYTDPYYSSLGGPNLTHLISFDYLQRHTSKWPCGFVMLNACYSAATKAGNYQQSFKTPELASYPILFLLNRKAVVTGAIWPTLEKASFIFTHLFLENLQNGCRIGQAFSIAVAQLSSMEGAEAAEILSSIDPGQTNDSGEAVCLSETLESMLHHPYCHGTFQIYRLF